MKLNSNESDNPLTQQEKGMDRQFLKDEIHMVNRHMKKVSVSLANRNV